MNLEVTSHARHRFNQRGIDESIIGYLIHYGDTSYAPGGAMKISLSKRNANKVIAALKKQIRNIEKAQGIMIVQKDGSILTGYHRM